MTVGTTLSSIVVSGNGVTTTFTYPFLIPQSSDAVVTYTDADSNATVLTTSQYSISGTGNENGGTITYPLSGGSPIADGTSLTISRVLPLIQPVSVSNQGPTFAAIEAGLDNLEMQIQQVDNTASRAITVNPADTTLPNPLPIASVRANQYLVFDSEGNPTIGAPVSDATVSSAMQPVVGAATIAAAVALLGVLPLTGGTLTGPLIADDGVTVSNSALALTDSTLAASDAGVFTNTQMNIGYSYVTNGLSPQNGYQLSHAGHYATIGSVNTMAVPSTSTVYEADGFASYITNSSTATGAAAGSFYAYNLATGAVSWGLNPLVSDQGFASTVSGAEFDIGASNVLSAAYGINMLGVFPNGTPATAIPYQVSVLNSPWQWGFVCYDGAAEQFALVGAAGVVANSDGQPMQFNVRDASNTVRTCGIQAIHSSSGATLVLDAPTGTVQISGLEAVSGTATFSDAIIVNEAGGVLASFTNGATQVGSISYDGSITHYNTTSDRELKNIHGPADGSLIDSLKVHTASFKSDVTGTQRSMLIADEAQQSAPWMVTGEPGAVYESDVVTRRGKVIHNKGDRKWQMVDHSALVPDLVAKCQALQAQVTELRADLAALISSQKGTA